MNDTVTISRNEYLRLRMESETLRRLEAGGVDNWEWYSDSLNADNNESISLDEFEEALSEELFNT